ncbi:hypothetical protein BH23BAC1_BH23BAC1_26820 [soil metagenome]
MENSKNKVKDVEYVLAVNQGLIVGVFKPLEWKEGTIENFPEFNLDLPGRLGFNEIEADHEVEIMYVGKKIPAKFRKKGASNPVKYSFN